MPKRNKGDMPRPKVNVMRHFTPPETPLDDKRKKSAKSLSYIEALNAFFQDIHEQVALWREISTDRGEHRRCHLPACKRHRECRSRNDPLLIDRFCHLKQRKRYTGIPGSSRALYGSRR